MMRSSKVLLGFVLFLIVLSISATFYKTVILEDFKMTGVYIEFPTEETSYVWFVYDDNEYELVIQSTNYEDIVASVSSELDIAVTELDVDFLEYLEEAYAGGEITSNEVASEETVPEDVPVDITEEVLEKDYIETE
jgi:hypothetical protein